MVSLGEIRDFSTSTEDKSTEAELNEPSCKEVLEAQDGSQCWVYDADTDTCSVKPECIAHECHPSKMTGFVNEGVFNANLNEASFDQVESFLNRVVTFQTGRLRKCDATILYDRDRRGFTYEIKLGECGMQSRTESTGSNNDIIFMQDISFLTDVEAEFKKVFF